MCWLPWDLDYQPKPIQSKPHSDVIKIFYLFSAVANLKVYFGLTTHYCDFCAITPYLYFSKNVVVYVKLHNFNILRKKKLFKCLEVDGVKLFIFF